MKNMLAVRLMKPITLLIVVAFYFALPSPAFAKNPAGVIVKLKGEVKIEQGKAGGKVAVEGDKFFVGDTFVTGSDGRAKLRFAEGGPNGKNEVVIAGSSRLFIEKAGSQGSGKSGTSLALEDGAIRTNVKKKYSGNGDDVFKVRTPNAVAGVRGTVFMMSFDRKTQASTLLTTQGRVAFAFGKNESMVGAGQVIRSAPNSPGRVEPAASSKSIPQEFKDLEGEESARNDGTGADSSGSTASGGGAGGSGGEGSGSVVGEAPPAALDRETVVSETPASSGDTAAAAPGTNMDRAPAGDAPAPKTGIIDSVVSAPPPPQSSVFTPPKVFVPPVSAITVEQVRQLDPNGKVIIKIGDL